MSMTNPVRMRSTQIITGFFFIRSRYTPMSGPKTNGGMVWSNPITVILKADPVSSYTNHSSATLFMLSPIWEMAWPENSKPKAPRLQQLPA